MTRRLGYDRVVTRLVRAIAMVLTLALSGVPLVADWCALSCEAAHASVETAAPTCHHAGSATPRIADVPAPCGHDHHPVVVDAATTGAAALRVLPAAISWSMISYASASSISTRAARVERVATSPPLPLTLAFSLRS